METRASVQLRRAGTLSRGSETRAISPPSNVSDVIVQDEFTHDVVIPWRQGLHLVFDTT